MRSSRGVSAGALLEQFYRENPGLLSFTVNVEECAKWLGVVLDPQPHLLTPGGLVAGNPPRITYRSVDPNPTKRYTLAYALGRLLCPTQAEQFALELLMPAPWVLDRWNRGERSIPELCRLFGVSEDLLSCRLQTLGVA